MNEQLLELEAILTNQLDVYSGLEKLVLEKKNYLVKGDIESLKKVDIEIEKNSLVLKDLEFKRTQVNKMFGKGNILLSEVIKSITDKEQADRLEKIGHNLKRCILNIKKYNEMNSRLIEHGLKMIEQSVSTISRVLVPESSAYGATGKLKKVRSDISSVQREA